MRRGIDDSDINSGALPPRPGTASERSKLNPAVRPGLSNFANLSYQIPDIYDAAATTAAAMLQKETNSDTLLRILDEKNAFSANELIMMSEMGDLVGLSESIKSGTNLLSCRGLSGYTPLHHACNRGHVAIVSEILRAQLSLINSINDTGETALHLAVYAGNMNIVEQLIDHGANVDAKNEYGETPLFYAARRNMPALVRLLLQRGADIDTIDRYGEKAADHSTTEHTTLAFGTSKVDQGSMLPLNELFLVFQFLDAKEICRCAMVAGKWHRVTETEGIWARLGVRRYILCCSVLIMQISITTT